MTDFHNSLDRALDDEHPYAWAPPADTSFVDEFQALQDSVNRAIIHQGGRYITFRITPPVKVGREYRWAVEHDAAPDDEPVGYDGFGAPLYAHQLDPKGTE